MEVNHGDLLRKIDGINNDFTKSKIAFSKYWTESRYKDSTGKSNREYQITKRGCEFLAHKTTGTKGNLFTDRYMDAFEKMKEVIEKPTSAMDILELQFEALKEVKADVDSVNRDLQEFKQDLPLLAVEMERITRAVKKVGTDVLGGHGSNAYNDKSLRGRVYSDIHREVKRQFGVDTYKAIKRNQCDLAISIISKYQVPLSLAEDIRNSNAQECFA